MSKGIDPTTILAFLAVADTCSFTVAAHRLGCKKSAVSKQVVRLEQALGYALFVRTTRKVVITPEGKRLVSSAKSVQHALTQFITASRQS